MHPRSVAATNVGLAVLVVCLETVRTTRAGADGQPAQEPSAAQVLTFSAAVDVILVDAVVTDEHGRPVRGLTAEDFVVREDGQPQPLTSFEAVDLAPAPAAQTRPPVPAAVVRASANDKQSEQPSRRVFVVVMDDSGLGLDGAAAAQRVAKRFLADASRPGDLVSLVLPGAGLTWSDRLPEGMAQLVSVLDSVRGLRTLSPELAGDWEALGVAEGVDPLAQERVRLRLDAAGLAPRETRFPGESDELYEQRNRAYQEPFVRADSRRQLDLDRDRRRRLFEAVSAALDAVATVKGRKPVLLFSEGFVQEPNDPSFRGLVAAARRNNASLYSVNVGRLTSGTAADSRQPGDRSASTRVIDPREAAGAEVVAEETGGFALHNPNDLEAGLARIALESSSYYLLGYSSTNPERDGKYRRLQVEVRRTDLTVRARRGYYAPSDKAPSRSSRKPGADPDLERALASSAPEREIPLRMTAFTLQPVDKARVRVRLVAEVGLKAPQFEKDGDGSRVATLDLVMALNHVRAAGRQRTTRREWKVRVAADAEGLPVFVPVEGSFDVPGGACQARLVVRHRGTGALGSVLHGFEVPDPGSWRVSTPILSDMPGEELGRPPQARIGRSFVAGPPLYCYLEVYRGADRRAAAPPRVSLAYTLVDARGKSRRSQPASLLGLSPEGTPARLEKIPLSGLPPGGYELRLSVRDEVSGRTQELREPFVLRRPSRPDVAIYVDLLRSFLAGDVARASSGAMEWRPEHLEKLAGALPPEDTALRRAALLLHTALAFRLWSNARVLEAEAQVAIARAVLAKGSLPDLHRDWLLALGHYRLAAASPLTALPFFEECARLFPGKADAWLGAGMCHELTAFPDGFALPERTSRGAAPQAERCYREAVRLDPRLAEARLRLGRVLARAEAFDEAEQELAAAVDASTEAALTALARVFWGGVRDARGDLAGAIVHYEAALSADPECQTAALALGEALSRSGRHRRAAEVLSSALSAPSPTELSPWHAYHVGSERWQALLAAPPESSPVAEGPALGEAP
jgi:VWFA-related protein